MSTVDDHRWIFCYANIETAGNGPRVRAFLRDVVEPALTAPDADIERWANTKEGGAPFAHADTRELVRATTEAFCLSVHSLFERQLRRWLAGCVFSLAHTLERVETAEKRSVNSLNALLHEVRGIGLSEFYSWPNLQRLELLANACRHGDGDSARRLFKRHPELWPNWPPMPFLVPGETDLVVPACPPSFNSIVVPRKRLHGFDNCWQTGVYQRAKRYAEFVTRSAPTPIPKIGKIAIDLRDYDALILSRSNHA